MSTYLQAVSEAALLKPLNPDDLSMYLKDGSFRISVYHKDNIVHFEGEACDKLEIILSGKVFVERIDKDGSLMTIAEFTSDDILGGNLLFSRNPYYPMTITAKLLAVILEISKGRLFDLFSKYHGFLKSYLEYVSDHAALLGDRIKHSVNRTIRESVLSFLDREMKIQNTDRIVLNMTKKALAEKIGV